jgi:hypothetical protein
MRDHHLLGGRPFLFLQRLQNEFVVLDDAVGELAARRKRVFLKLNMKSST